MGKDFTNAFLPVQLVGQRGRIFYENVNGSTSWSVEKDPANAFPSTQIVVWFSSSVGNKSIERDTLNFIN